MMVFCGVGVWKCSEGGEVYCREDLEEKERCSSRRCWILLGWGCGESFDDVMVWCIVVVDQVLGFRVQEDRGGGFSFMVSESVVCFVRFIVDELQSCGGQFSRLLGVEEGQNFVDRDVSFIM